MSDKQSLNRFGQLRKRVQRLLAHLQFLQCCQKQGRYPKSFTIDCHLPSTKRISKATIRCQRILLSAKIQDLRGQIAHTEATCYRLHIQLAQHFGPSWVNYDSCSYLEAQREGELTTRRLSNKLKSLRPLISTTTSPATPTNSSLLPDYVVNYSSQTLSSQETTLLNKGLNFNCIRKEDPLPIVSTIENKFKHSDLSSQQKGSLRTAIARVLTSPTATQTTTNLTKKESLTLKSLHNKDLIVCQSDKGNRCVVLDKQQYRKGLHSMLDTDHYTQLPSDPLLSQAKQVTASIKSNVLTKEHKYFLIPRNFQHGRFYVVPKIHKPTLSFRPVLSTVNTPTAKLAKFLTNLISNRLPPNPYTVRNSQEFVTRLTHPSNMYPSDSTLISLDIVSLYTNVPIAGAIQRLRQRLTDSHCDSTFIDNVCSLTMMCLNTNTFQVDNIIYIQKEGLPMGSSLSPLLADNYLFYLEKELFTNYPLQIKPWYRYVDDTFIIWNYDMDAFNTFFTFLNNQDPHLQFTKDLEEDGQLPFLDVLIQKDPRDNNLFFKTSIHRKPYAFPSLTASTSNQPPSQKIGTIYAFVQRAIRLTNFDQGLQRELSYLRTVCIHRGYSPSLVDRAFNKYTSQRTIITTLQAIKDEPKPFLCLPAHPLTTKIGHILRPFFKTVYRPTHTLISSFPSLTDKRQLEHMAGIYLIPCECDLLYVGQTIRNFRERLKEHQADIKHGRFFKSSLAKHAMDTGHKISFDEASIHYPLRYYYHLDTLETLTIHHFGQHSMNERSTNVSSTWINNIFNSSTTS